MVIACRAIKGNAVCVVIVMSVTLNIIQDVIMNIQDCS